MKAFREATLQLLHAHSSAHTDQIQFEAQGLGFRGSDEGGKCVRRHKARRTDPKWWRKMKAFASGGSAQDGLRDKKVGTEICGIWLLSSVGLAHRAFGPFKVIVRIALQNRQWVS